MQNQHVTPYSNRGGPPLYAGVDHQQNGDEAFAIDPSLEEPWPNQQQQQQPDPHQYAHQRYSVNGLNYNPYAQHPPPQPGLSGYNGMAQANSYSPYPPPTNHFTNSFFNVPAAQQSFSPEYNNFSAQAPQNQTISPQALQVEDRVPRHFHQRELNQRQIYDRNAQQGNWPQERPTANSSAQFPDLLNSHAAPVPTSTVPPTQQPARASLDYSSYLSQVTNRSPAVPSYGFNSVALRGGEQSNEPMDAPLRDPNPPAPLPNPPRVTDQALLDRYPLENDAAHRVKDLPFVVLGENVTQLDIRGKTTIPKYHARGNSIGKKFAPRTDLFATRSAVVPEKKKKRGRPPKNKQAATAVKSVSSKSAITKEVKARLAGLKKQGSPATPSLESSSADSSSEAESEDESEEEEEMRALIRLQDVRAPVRPTDDPAAAARYDAVSIVFKEGIQHGQITREEVIKAVQAYEPFIVKLRDNYRSSVAALQEATSQKRQSQIPRLTQAKVVNYQALTNALSETLEHGHNDIIKNLGTNHKTVVGLWTVLTDFVKADDFASELPLIVLELLAKFEGLTAELLKKLKFESIQKRVVKKGTDKMKELLAVISSNAAAEGKRENDTSSNSASLQRAMVQPAREGAAPNTTTTPRVAGMKRPHEGEDSNGNPAKKIASGATSTLTARTITTTKTAPRPNVFANLTRSVKPSKPLNGSNKPKAASGPPKPVAKTAPPMTTRFGDLLASINKPKEVPKAPVVAEGPPETAEEKKKRERKESRRHLRVKWREGDDLTQVKIFTQMEGEEEGRKSEMVRDAHDDRSEGMMHKQRAQEEVVDIDEDDAGGEVEYRPYPDLYAVDFSDIDDQQRSKSYVTRGGQQTFSTPQQEIQNRHESTELMVVYTDPSDIPPSAKEPPVSNDKVDQGAEEKFLGQPTDQWLHQRMQEVQLFGARRAIELAASRNNEQRIRDGQNVAYGSNINNASQPQQQHQFSQAGQTHRQQAHTTPTMSSNVSPEQTAEAQALVSSIMAIIKPIIGKPFPPTEPPSHMNERQKAEWWEGYNRDMALKATNSAQEQNHFIAPVQQPQMAQPAMQQPQTQSHQPAMSTPQVQAPPAFDLQNIMRQINLASSPDSSQLPQQSVLPMTQVPVPGYNFMQNFNDPNAANQVAQQGWPNQHANGSNMAYNPQAGNNMAWGDGANDNRFVNPQANQNWMQNWASNDNKMQWERDNNSNGHSNNQHNRYRDRDDTRGVRERDDGSARQKKNYKIGTKPCRFFLEDKCAKGDKCTYLHER